jgi:hypothetical protein
MKKATHNFHSNAKMASISESHFLENSLFSVVAGAGLEPTTFGL